MSRTARLVCCGVLAVASAIGPPPPLVYGQAPQAAGQQPFRSSATLVEVDAIIVDKSGRFVPGLKADDLTLLEDGKPQKIQQFYMVTHDRGARAEVIESAAAADAERAQRIFVIVFDEGSLANDSFMRVQQGAEDFIRNQMAEGDVGGVFVNSGMYRGRLTTDRSELLAGVRSAKPLIDNRQSLLAPFREFPRIPSESDAVRIADGARELVDALGVKACAEDPGDCEMAGGVQQVENLIQQKSRLYVRQARRLTGQTIQNLQTVARGLSRIPGRKTVVFLSEGFFVEDSRGTLEKIAAEAARGGTTIYSIDGRGLTNGTSPNPDVVRRERARATMFDTGEDGPNILTANTGGLIIRNIDDMSRAFGMIVRDTSTYYVIGYQPDNATMDGKFRRIEVKSTNGDLKVRARKGYVAVALPPQATMFGGGR